MHTVRRVKDAVPYLLCAVFGAGLIIGGTASLADSSGKVMCGWRQMHPGDNCSITRNGRTTTRSFDQQRADSGWAPWILLSIGGLMVAGGAVGLTAEFRRESDFLATR
ncbi:hypothetical protein [Nocardia inohanensis]|uniref:hypothetical protein n=1 Tax=Nocardia inohanensis TaxID=209246 RepID=UPI000836D00D|nr:hypothetical protein [Nocardia inohanensis]